MKGARKGIALAVALAAVVALASLAALSGVAARAAVRESAALLDHAQAARNRALLRVRVARLVARTPRGELLATAHAIGVRDTAAHVLSLPWPWHRVEVRANGGEVVAELAQATTPDLPWCAAVVVSGTSAVAPGAVTMASSTCGVLVDTTTSVAIDEFADSLASRLVLRAPPDTLLVAASGGPGVWRAAAVLDVAAGVQVEGVLLAPVVRLGPGSVVRGMVVARDVLAVVGGASIVGDLGTVGASFATSARLRLLGRRGLLRAP